MSDLKEDVEKESIRLLILISCTLLLLVILSIDFNYFNGHSNHLFIPRMRHYTKFVKLTWQTIPGFFGSFLILISSGSILVYRKQIYNWLLLSKKEFTSDREIIEFVNRINPDFTNKYSVSYCNQQENIQKLKKPTEIAEAKYQHLVSKTELLEQASNIVVQYQHDRSFKNYQSMVNYLTEPFLSKQKKDFSAYKITYNYNINQIIPVDLDLTDSRYFFRLLINGSKIDFKVSRSGYILSGSPETKLFNEYWDFEIRRDNLWDTQKEVIKKFYLLKLRTFKRVQFQHSVFQSLYVNTTSQSKMIHFMLQRQTL